MKENGNQLKNSGLLNSDVQNEKFNVKKYILNTKAAFFIVHLYNENKVVENAYMSKDMQKIKNAIRIVLSQLCRSFPTAYSVAYQVNQVGSKRINQILTALNNNKSFVIEHHKYINVFFECMLYFWR